MTLTRADIEAIRDSHSPSPERPEWCAGSHEGVERFWKCEVRDLATTALGLMEQVSWNANEADRQAILAAQLNARVRALEEGLREVLDAIDAQMYHIDYRPRDKGRALLSERDEVAHENEQGAPQSPNAHDNERDMEKGGTPEKSCWRCDEEYAGAGWALDVVAKMPHTCERADVVEGASDDLYMAARCVDANWSLGTNGEVVEEASLLACLQELRTALEKIEEK